MFWIVYFIGAMLVGYKASKRDCGFFRGFLLSIFLTPLIAIIMVMLCPSKKEAETLGKSFSTDGVIVLVILYILYSIIF